MSKSARKKRQKVDVATEDGAEMYGDDIDLDELSRDIFSTDWGDFEERYEKSGSDARRRIERRRDMKKLHSELDDWEEFGSGGDW